jgi:hypothetical protein
LGCDSVDGAEVTKAGGAKSSRGIEALCQVNGGQERYRHGVGHCCMDMSCYADVSELGQTSGA